MKLSDTKILVEDRLVDATPELVAKLFSCMFSDEQASFFNYVGENSTKWRGGIHMQLQYITDEDGLTLAGRRAMQGIGDYSHWGLVDRLGGK